MSEVDTIQQKFLDSISSVFGEKTVRIVKKMFIPALILGGMTYAEEVLLDYLSRNNYSVDQAEIMGSVIRGIAFTTKFVYVYSAENS